MPPGRRRRGTTRARRARTQDTQASFEAGSKQRWATSANKTRSTISPSRRRPVAAFMQRPSDPEPVPELIEHVRAPKRRTSTISTPEPSVRSDRFARLEEAADRRDETAPEPLGPPCPPGRSYGSPCDRRSSHRVTLVVGELEIATTKPSLFVRRVSRKYTPTRSAHQPAQVNYAYAYTLQRSRPSLTPFHQGRCLGDPPPYLPAQ